MSQKQQVRTRNDSDEYVNERVVEGTVMRITGAGHLVVYPSTHTGLIREGNPVKVIVSEQTVRTNAGLPMVEAREDHITKPISSTWAIIVSGRKSIERCQVFYNRTQLSTIDHMGELRTEARMPRDGSLSFHIPDSMELNEDFLVEVRDGAISLETESFGAVRPRIVEQK